MLSPTKLATLSASPSSSSASSSSARTASSPSPRSTLRAADRGERLAREHRPQHRLLARRQPLDLDARRAAPTAPGPTPSLRGRSHALDRLHVAVGEHDLGVQVVEPELPLVAPDRPRHVHHVVVRGRRPLDVVGDVEGPLLVLGAVVPDDAEAGGRPAVLARELQPLGAERPGTVERAQHGVAARLVRLAVLGHAHVRRPDAARQRHVAERAREVAAEVEGEPLGHMQARVRTAPRPARRHGRSGSASAAPRA